MVDFRKPMVGAEYSARWSVLRGRVTGARTYTGEIPRWRNWSLGASYQSVVFLKMELSTCMLSASLQIVLTVPFSSFEGVF